MKIGEKVNKIANKIEELSKENAMLRQMCKFKGITMNKPSLSGPITMKPNTRKNSKRVID